MPDTCQSHPDGSHTEADSLRCQLARLEVEHARTAAALRESEARYQNLAANVTDLICRCNPDGVHVYVSPVSQTLLGYAPSELLGRAAGELVHAEDAEVLRGAWTEALRGAAAPVTIRLQHKDGHYLWTEAILRNVPNGHDTGFRLDAESTTQSSSQATDGSEILVVARDISLRKRLEEQVVQAQKMEAVGRLAGGIAHDFNNLLTAILGFTNLLLKNRPAGDPARPDLEQIKKAGDRATALTRQLLAFSRKQVLRLETLDLNAIVRDMNKMLRRLIGEDIELELALAADLQPVKADRSQLEQVFMNLVVNARDAMPQGGKLTITTANVTLDSSRGDLPTALAKGNYIRLTVRDTGCGMDRETRERLFEPFFTTKGQGKGTGLGLATVYGIVTQSGGQIFVASDLGRGTTFDIYLPALDFVTAAPGESLAALSLDKRGPGSDPGFELNHLGTETVLLAEDEDILRNLVGVILRQHGYKVLEARNGPEALDRVASHEGAVDLLITDVVMPQMNGRQLVERLTAIRPQVKVLYISGYAGDAMVRHGIAGSGAAFLSKPFTPTALVRKVREVLEAGKTA